MSTPVEVAELKLEAARAKAAKLEAHLEGAQQAVREALAELEAARQAEGTAEPLEHSGEVTYAHAEHAEGTGRTGMA
jgi:multidrug resistance efflux pump